MSHLSLNFCGALSKLPLTVEEKTYQGLLTYRLRLSDELNPPLVHQITVILLQQKNDIEFII